MKNKIKRIFLLFLLIATVIPMSTLHTYAKEITKIISVKQNKWAKMKIHYDWYYEENLDYIEQNTEYKIKVPDNYYVKIYIKGSKKTRKEISLYSHESDYLSVIVKEPGDVESCEYFVLPKGEYYLATDNTGVQFKYSLIRFLNKNNYCAAKAISLNPSKTIYVAQSPKYNYNRWYKIKLKRKQVLNYWTNCEYNVQLYNSKLRPIDIVKSSSTKYHSYSELKPGTYYACIHSYDYNETETGYITTFKWK